MYRGYVKIWRKIIDSPVFLDAGLYKLFTLCLFLANHKAEWVQMEGYVKPIPVLPGQFITGRYQLHGMYHQWRKGYKKRSPSPRTVWRWLHFLKEMQILTIKSFNKFSIITVINWETYQQNDQQMTNRWPADDHKQECIKNELVEVEDSSLFFSCQYFSFQKDYIHKLQTEFNGQLGESQILDLCRRIRDYVSDNPGRYKMNSGHLASPKNVLRNWISRELNDNSDSQCRAYLPFDGDD